MNANHGSGTTKRNGDEGHSGTGGGHTRGLGRVGGALGVASVVEVDVMGSTVVDVDVMVVGERVVDDIDVDEGVVADVHRGAVVVGFVAEPIVVGSVPHDTTTHEHNASATKKAGVC